MHESNIIPIDYILYRFCQYTIDLLLGVFIPENLDLHSNEVEYLNHLMNVYMI